MNNGNQELKVYLYKEYEESGKNWRALNKNQIIFWRIQKNIFNHQQLWLGRQGGSGVGEERELFKGNRLATMSLW